LEIGVIPHTRLFIAFDELHKTCLIGDNIDPRDTVPYFYDVLTAAALTGAETIAPRIVCFPSKCVGHFHKVFHHSSFLPFH
jgi:hypothetical protein